MTETTARLQPAVTSGRRAGRATSPAVVLAVVLTGQLMAIIDVNIVNVAVPAIHSSLHTTGSGLQLIVAGYTIAYAVLLITGARLGDILGHRRMFLAGIGLFTLASLGCGLAPSAGTLVALRFLQGAGAAAMIPQVLSLIQRTYTAPGPRARAMTLYATIISGGAVLGQVLGGLLVSANLFGSSWRPVFLVNVPVGLARARLRPAAARAGAARPAALARPARSGGAHPGRARVRAAAGARAAARLAGLGLGPAGAPRCCCSACSAWWSTGSAAGAGSRSCRARCSGCRGWRPGSAGSSPRWRYSAAGCSRWRLSCRTRWGSRRCGPG